jgi:hypothetical protein
VSYPKIAKAVQAILKTKAKAGQTTKSDTALQVWKKIEKTGGPTKYGIGSAAMTMAMMHIIEVEVTRAFKLPLTNHDIEFRLPPSVRADVKAIMQKVPRWIAIDEGKDAIWISTLKATSQHWLMNGQMKEKKAIQTEQKANISIEVGLFLDKNGFENLEEAIR